ncbi:hypothetical protein, conserved [Leishmania donovani]|uniref:Dynein regulatory complex protein 10 n=1 Tax=Leishmania donovani TaxID=5661 RepID=E9BD01_LEIDO|nr:hypothetical protein, conserved [Leishmania donovani]AYU77726.1 hypothetical protein LdCL_160019900 [Leishmania donovani]CBZ33127.1 hypothetical protein, conserved [Leishmania donovani]
MEMDPMTRQEAAKVENVLADLAEELQILAFLPDEFSSWVRDESVVAATLRDTNMYLRRYEEHAVRKTKEAEAKHDVIRGTPTVAGLRVSALSSRPSSGRSSSSCSSWAKTGRHGDGAASDLPISSSSSSLTPEYEEERQRAVKAACFVYAASHYGDLTANDDNEAVLQVSDYAQLERDLLAGAHTIGSVDAADLQAHHLSTRALIDTLRDGGYGDIMKYHVKHLYTSHFSSTAASQRPGPSVAASDSRVLSQAYRCGMIDEDLDRLRGLVVTLHRLIRQRNQSTVNEDMHRYQLLHDAVNRDQAGTADVQVLNQRYLDIKAARQREVAGLDREIEALEEELQYVQRTADIELEAFQSMQETVQEDRRCSLRQQLEVHRKNADEVARRLQQAQAKALDELNTLRSNRTKREAAVSGAITEYDAQSALLEAAMRQLNHEAEEDTERIVALEEVVEKLHKEREEHAWEVMVAEQRQEHAKVICEHQEHDARVIQAYYRAFIARVHTQRELEKNARKRKKKGRAKK